MIDIIRENIIKLMKKEISKKELLQKINLDEEKMYAVIGEMFDLASKSKDAEMAEDAVYLVFLYENSLYKLVDRLNRLIECDWHEQHENIAMLLQKSRDVSSISCLYNTANAKYEYLDFDDNYALAVKCIWALGDIGNEESKEYLKKLLNSENEIIVENARKQLERKN